MKKISLIILLLLACLQPVYSCPNNYNFYSYSVDTVLTFEITCDGGPGQISNYRVINRYIGDMGQIYSGGFGSAICGTGDTKYDCSSITPPSGKTYQKSTNTYIDIPVCPEGQTGTPPNCITPTCPQGQTGTPPNCVDISCPTGQFGTPPNCYNYCENIDVNNPPTSCVPRPSTTCDPQYYQDGGVCTIVPNCNSPNSGGYVPNQYFDIQSKTCKNGTNPESVDCYVLDTIHLAKYGIGSSPYPSPRYYCPPFDGCIPEDVNCHNYPTTAELEQVGLGVDGTNHAEIPSKIDEMKVKADEMLVKAADQLDQKYQDKINKQQIVQVDLSTLML
jgi:hypothetical protein